MFKSYVKGTYLFYIFLAFLISCSENQTSNKISWEGDSFYVNRESDEYKIDYSVTLDVTSMEIGTQINIFSFPEGENIDNFSVVLIEKEVRVDGVKFCRIWGNSEIYVSMNYVVVNDCLY
jgi:hypothetical protein